MISLHHCEERQEIWSGEGEHSWFPLVLMLNHANFSFGFHGLPFLRSPRLYAMHESVFERACGFSSHGYLHPGVEEHRTETGAIGHSRTDGRQGKAPVLHFLPLAALKHQPAAGLGEPTLTLGAFAVAHVYLWGEFFNRQKFGKHNRHL